MVNQMPIVLVMMAAYNGEDYIEEQIASVLCQEDVVVHLLISDDGSTDSTQHICEEMSKKYENVTFQINATNKGVSKNFMDMVYSVDPSAYDYFAFSDQDDFWLPEKLAKAIEVLTGHDDRPSLYYSDVINVDENLQNGRREYAAYHRCERNMCTLLCNNWATGCTMVFNRELCSLLQREPVESFPRLHDVWVHLVALSCGQTFPDLSNSYILRRITGRNVSGVSPIGTLDRARLKGMFSYLFMRSDHYAVLTANELNARYGDVMNPEVADIVNRFSSMDASMLSRVRIASDGRFRLPYKKETFILKFRILLNKM